MADGGIWTRLTRWLRGSAGGGSTRDGGDITRLQDRMDDSYRSQTQLLSQVRRGVADVATSRKRVQIQLVSLRRDIAAADESAKAAVERGDDSGARSALARQVMLEKAERELADRHATLAAEEDKLTASADEIERRIEDFRLRKDTLTARRSAAEARTEIQAATQGIGASTGEVGRAMAEAERHTRELEATADAVDELVNEGIIARPGETEDEALQRRFDEALGSVEPAPAPVSPREENGDGPHPISQ